MTGVLIVFIISLLICCAIAYILGLFWFSDIRNRRFGRFFILGIEVFIWTLLNAITIVSNHEYFPVIYTLRMVMVCIIPFGITAFIFDFIKFPLRNNIFLRITLFTIPVIDIICMVTNPLHYLYFLNYDYPVPARAILFWIHIVVDFTLVIIVFVLLILYIIKGVRRNPLLILTGLGLLIPYIYNVLYSFGMIKFPHDVTPIGFFFTLLLFMFVSYRLQLFNIKTSLFSSTMDSIGDIIVIFNEKDVVMDVNRSAVETFNDFEFEVGRTKFDAYFNYINSIILESKPNNFVEIIKNNHSAEGECSVKLQNGKIQTYTFSWHTVHERNKKSGYIFMMMDVSNYREMIIEINNQKEKAESASRAKGEFLSRMSHEMRTPMNAVIGMTQVALKSGSLDESVEDSLLKIKGASNHLLGVINDVLDMSKIESGKFTLSENKLEIKEFVQNIRVMADINTEQKQQNFYLTIDENIPPVIIADSQRLMQVTVNLLANAFKFTPVGGAIDLIIKMTEQNDDYVVLRIEVRDNGIGISKDKQANLFQPFEQADNSISRNFGGTGLGLAISKSIVELMGGTIWIESSSDAGSCFMFTIQAKYGDILSDDDENIDEIPDIENEFEGLNILLADDVEINREVIQALFEGSGAVFDNAENGQSAYEMYLRNPDRYHIIFMDLQMPVLDGLTATAAIRRTEFRNSATIPIIAMTANAFKEDIEACLNAGMNDHISKPVDIIKIKKIIRKYYK